MALSKERKLLFLEAFFYLILARLLILMYSFKKIARKLGQPMQETSMKIQEELAHESMSLGKMVKKASLYSPFRALCFEQALALKFMLNRRKIPCTIYFGVNNNEKVSLLAHAWTRVGENYLTGAKTKDQYQIISTFG